MTKSLPEVVSKVYALLDPLESQDRQKVVGSVMTLLGEKAVTSSPPKPPGDEEDDETVGFGPKAKRWMKQNAITGSAIEEVFHCEGNEVEVIASEIPGSGKRAQTYNCYLLVGIRSLLATDEAKFSDADSVTLCNEMGCHDSPNHAKYRNEIGNIVAGSKTAGFTLPAPGLRAVAAIIKEMSTSS